MKAKPAGFRRNLKIYESLYDEARLLGIFPLKNPLEGIELDIQLAKALNARRTPRKNRRSR
jgi:hypothetical protein